MLNQEKKHIVCGVPQGSIVESNLFNICVNDIVSVSDTFKHVLFADDTHLLYSYKNVQTVENVVNGELSKINNWLYFNTQLNISSTKYIILDERKTPANLHSHTVAKFGEISTKLI